MGVDVMRLIDEIDWSSLHHNYGCAGDTPAHLRALTSADGWRAGCHHLEDAVCHSGHPIRIFAPVTRVVARMLAEEKAAPQARQSLVEFLGWMAYGTSVAEKLAVELLPSLEEATQQSYPVVMKFLDEPDIYMRRAAVNAAVEHVRTRGLAHHRPALAARLRGWARARREERIYWVKNLVDLNEDTEEFLVDEDGHVRVAAALSLALADNAAATDIIVEALFRAAPNSESDCRDVYFLPNGAYGLHYLIKAAIERVEDLQRLAIPAAKIATHEHWTGCDSTWGLLMFAIFKPPYSQGDKPTPLQRHFLAALLENSKIWGTNIGNISLSFKQAGLPYNRDACARIVGAS